MFEFVNFVIKQLQRLKKALAQPELNDFAPDGKSAAGRRAAFEHSLSAPMRGYPMV